MKRYVCTVATGLLLALASTGTATASGLPILGQSGEQKTSFGDQTVGEQSNDADVTQKQGNGNLNIAPAVAILGDAETKNAQGNDNTATADVDQSNSVDQSQSSTQKQSLEQSDGGSCCGGQSQTGEQKVYGGDQSVDEQRNDADVNQFQGNGNVNVAPAIAIFGDAESTNYQGNGNEADATVTQSNDASQSQTSTQKQSLDQNGGSCCGGQSQTGEQKTSFGDQHVGKQRNDADVTQAQGNGNVNVSPAIAIFGDAETKNAQGNDNTATADVDQSNSVDQSQSSYQKQSLRQGDVGCCDGRSQTAEQKVYGGDQSVEKQRNEADVNQWQGNGNLNISPAIAVFGDAETRNYQGNHNSADANVTQSNEATQSQSSTQKQYLEQDGGSCCKPSYGCKPADPCKPEGYEQSKKERCCDAGPSQTAEQKTSFGNQHVGEQKNSADVTQKQGNGNVSFAPALSRGGAKHDSCKSKCGKYGKSWEPRGGKAETTNKQGNGNEATADVDQSNSVDQSQTSYQQQVLDACKGLIHR